METTQSVFRKRDLVRLRRLAREGRERSKKQLLVVEGLV